MIKRLLKKLLVLGAGLILLNGCGGSSTPEGPPYITDYSMPVDGESVQPVLTITFNKEIDETRNSSDNFELLDELNTSVVFTSVIDGKYARITPSANLAYASNYTLKVSGIVDLTGTVMAGTRSIPFTTTDFVTSITPEVNATEVGVFSDVVITFGEAINPATLVANLSGLTFNTTTADNKTFTLTPNGGASYDLVYSGMAAATTVDITVDADDQYGTTIPATFVSSFTTVTPDAVPPAVTSMVPEDGAGGIGGDINITIVFDEDLIPPTGGNFTFEDVLFTPIAFSTSYDQTTRTVTITPSSILEYGQTYTLTMTGIQDIFGNTMGQSMSFTTSTILKSTYPTDGDTEVAVDSTVIALFEGTVDTSGASFLIDGGAVSGTVTYAGSMAIFTPDADFGYGTTYTATLSGVKDSGGNTLATHTWYFTTVSDTTRPTVLSLSPASGATGVSTAATIVVTYDEAIQGTGEIILQDSSGKGVGGSLSYGVDSITFTPSSALKNAEAYSAVVSNERDISGNRAKTTTWVFTTQP